MKSARHAASTWSASVSGTVESAWGAVPALLLVRFPRPLTEPGVRLSPHRALHGSCRGRVEQCPAVKRGLPLRYPGDRGATIRWRILSA